MSLEFGKREAATEFVVPLGEGAQAIETITVDRHWYLTEDGDRVVEENHPDCRWLWATPGQEVSRVEAERLGLLKPVPAELEAEELAPADPAPDPKGRKPAANKLRGADKDK